MKNLVLILATVFITAMGFSTNNDLYRANYDGNSFIFVEGNVEFSVFPDGQFDFVYIGNQDNASLSNGQMTVTFNSGYNYDAYVQYDHYGAIIQVEDVPIYYDDYGRIVRAGSVSIRYHDRRVSHIGGMHIHYNRYGYYSHYTGFINIYNRHYVYRPWHVYYVVPYYSYCIVHANPYRRYYTPVRYAYSYHVVHYTNRSYSNGRRDFFVPNSRVHYQDGRTAVNTNYRGTTNRNNNETVYRRSDAVIRSAGERVGTTVNRNNTAVNRAGTVNSANNRNAVRNNSITVNRSVQNNRTAERTTTTNRSNTVKNSNSVQTTAPQRNSRVSTANTNRTETTNVKRENSSNVSNNRSNTTAVNRTATTNKRNTTVNTTTQRSNSSVNRTNTTNNRNTSASQSNNRGNNSSSVRGGRG